MSLCGMQQLSLALSVPFLNTLRLEPTRECYERLKLKIKHFNVSIVPKIRECRIK